MTNREMREWLERLCSDVMMGSKNPVAIGEIIALSEVIGDEWARNLYQEAISAYHKEEEKGMYEILLVDEVIFRTPNFDEAVKRFWEERRGELVDPDGYATTWEEFLLDA